MRSHQPPFPTGTCNSPEAVWMAISVLPAETPETPISPPSTLTAAMPASSEDAATDPSPPHTKSSSPPKGSALRGNR